MKLNEQFEVAGETPEQLWKLVDQPELVAACMPGVEGFEVIGPDDISARISQAIGPMSATFDMRVRILERIDGESIRFAAVGKSVRGAVGRIRAENSVTLAPVDGGTLVTLESELALAGALGSVGQKVVAKQAGRVTAEFAENLRRFLAGEPPAKAERTPSRRPAARSGPGASQPVSSDAAVPGERWAKASFIMSAITTAVGVAVLIRLRRAAR